MQNLMLKIAAMAQDNGLVKFEKTSIFGKAAALAAYKGFVKHYSETSTHITVAANE